MNEDIKKYIDEKVDNRIYESHSALSQVQSQHYGAIKENLDKLNGYGKIYRFIKKDIGLGISIILFIVSIVSPYFLIKSDIALIRQDVGYIKEQITGLKSSIQSLGETDKSLMSRNAELSQIVYTIKGALDQIGFLKQYERTKTN